MSDRTNGGLDPVLLRGLTQARPSRRDALRLLGLAGAGTVLAAGCGVKGKGNGGATPSQDAVQKYWSGKKKHGKVRMANWPLYIDPKHTELKEFTKKTGIEVTYKEVIQEDDSWFAKIQPQLAAGQSIGYDVMVVTDGIEFTELVKLGYLVPLDHARMPNFKKHVGRAYTDESFDFGNVYSMPWASGMTGIAYNPDKLKAAGLPEPTKIADLWDIRYKGKVGMMSDTQELGNFGMMVIGVDPEKSRPADWKKAAAKLKKQRDDGIVRKYYEQDYIKPLTAGDILVTMAWSGDIYQQNVSEKTNLKFILPEEGATIWTDNMMIPKTAANPVDAIELMDFFYRPQIAASLAEYINYVTPVPDAKKYILADAAKASGKDAEDLTALAKSPLIFPSESDYKKLRHFRMLPNAKTKQEYESIFQPIVQS